MELECCHSIITQPHVPAIETTDPTLKQKYDNVNICDTYIIVKKCQVKLWTSSTLGLCETVKGHIIALFIKAFVWTFQ